jgi:general secretion pathway protein A
MYKKFFGLRENPFNVNPNPRYLFLTRHTEEALACLTYGIQSRKGFILLTGEVGTGKTTLLRKLMDWLNQERVKTAFVFNSRLNTSQFFDFMMTDFGIQCESRLKSRVLLSLNEWLLERYRAGETAVLIVDEAQNLSAEVLEEIRLLTNLETSTEKLLQIVLTGQPELEQKLNQPHLRQLRQRITLRCKTHALTLEETQGYIVERLRIAGADGQPIFSPEAVNAVHLYSRGIPRVVNLLCEHSLISAFIDQNKPVAPATVETVAREFDLHEVDPRAPSKSAVIGENVRLMEALQQLTTLVEQMCQADVIPSASPERKI